MVGSKTKIFLVLNSFAGEFECKALSISEMDDQILKRVLFECIKDR